MLLFWCSNCSGCLVFPTATPVFGFYCFCVFYWRWRGVAFLFFSVIICLRTQWHGLVAVFCLCSPRKFGFSDMHYVVYLWCCLPLIRFLVLYVCGEMYIFMLCMFYGLLCWWVVFPRANAQQPKLFVGMILILIFAEALALYGLIVGIILSSRAGQSRAD